LLVASFSERASDMGATDGRLRGLFGCLIYGLAIGVVQVEGGEFGSSLSNLFTVFSSLPVNGTSLETANWTGPGSCEPQKGHRWTELAAGNSEWHPVGLYTDSTGMPSGLSLDVHGDVPAAQQKWFEDIGSGKWRLFVGFRSVNDACEPNRDVSNTSLGDQLVVNQGGTYAKGIPLEVPTDGKWSRGSCYKTLGWHYFQDTVGRSTMTWDAGNLFPVGVMYHAGKVHGIMVNVPFTQSNNGTHGWDPMTLTNQQMCNQWCDHACTFTGAESWSSYHIAFEPVENVTCPSELQCVTDNTTDAAMEWGCCSERINAHSHSDTTESPDDRTDQGGSGRRSALGALVPAVLLLGVLKTSGF